MVVKKDGRRERFERQKLIAGLLQARAKSAPSASRRSRPIADRVEMTLQDRPEKEMADGRHRRLRHAGAEAARQSGVRAVRVRLPSLPRRRRIHDRAARSARSEGMSGDRGAESRPADVVRTVTLAAHGARALLLLGAAAPPIERRRRIAPSSVVAGRARRVRVRVVHRRRAPSTQRGGADHPERPADDVHLRHRAARGSPRCGSTAAIGSVAVAATVRYDNLTRRYQVSLHAGRPRRRDRVPTDEAAEAVRELVSMFRAAAALQHARSCRSQHRVPHPRRRPHQAAQRWSFLPFWDAPGGVRQRDFTFLPREAAVGASSCCHGTSSDRRPLVVPPRARPAGAGRVGGGARRPLRDNPAPHPDLDRRCCSPRSPRWCRWPIAPPTCRRTSSAKSSSTRCRSPT